MKYFNVSIVNKATNHYREVTIYGETTETVRVGVEKSKDILKQHEIVSSVYPETCRPPEKQPVLTKRLTDNKTNKVMHATNYKNRNVHPIGKSNNKKRTKSTRSLHPRTQMPKNTLESSNQSVWGKIKGWFS